MPKVHGLAHPIAEPGVPDSMQAIILGFSDRRQNFERRGSAPATRQHLSNSHARLFALPIFHRGISRFYRLARSDPLDVRFGKPGILYSWAALELVAVGEQRLKPIKN